MHKWLLGLTLLCFGCQNHTFYHSYQPVDDTGWCRSDSLQYELPTDFPQGEYKLYLGVKHCDTYPYRDLWLAIHQDITDSLSVEQRTDTVHLYLANAQGRWKGHGIGGTRQFISDSPLRLHQEDKKEIKLTINHIMKDEPLRDISFVGIRLDKKPD